MPLDRQVIYSTTSVDKLTVNSKEIKEDTQFEATRQR